MNSYIPAIALIIFLFIISSFKYAWFHLGFLLSTLYEIKRES